MKHLLTFTVWIICVFSLHAISTHPTNDTKKVVIDTEKSTIRWDGYKVTGKHHGQIKIHSGELLFRGEQLTGGHFVIDMHSIEVQDLQGDSRTRLENHLKSDDFFGVETYPQATLEIIKATSSNQQGAFEIEARLTVKEKTHPILFDATINSAGEMTIAEAKMKVDRSLYDVRYGSGSFFDNLGDKTIYNEFDIAVYLEGREDLKN